MVISNIENEDLESLITILRQGGVQALTVGTFSICMQPPTPPELPDTGEIERALAQEGADGHPAMVSADPLADPATSSHGSAIGGFARYEKPEGYDEG
jgi:hypothetical protein